MAKQRMPEKLGRYNIVRELGKGAMGVVYEGIDPTINRRVAIKTARREVLESSGRADELMARFLREATATGSLNHPNIITIYDASEEDDMAYIAMEFLEGGDLFDVMERKQRFKPEEAVEIGALVCDALAEAHKHGVIHRDIKPANILMPTDAAPKVADFGIARVEDSNLTQEGAMIGTPHYMSPEQFMGQRANARSDLFSVGIIVYEMLTGEKPFGGEALSTVMHNVIKSEPIAPTELNFAINDCLNKVVLKALSKRPQDRYQSAAEMAAALRESLKPSPDPAVTQVEAGEPGATVAGQAPEDMATIVAAKLPDGDESPAASPRRPAGKKLPIPAIIAGVTVTVIALVAAISLLAGGKEEAGGEGGTPQESGRPAPPPQPDAYFKAANIVLVCVDDTGEPYTQASEAVERAIDQGSRLPELSGIEGCSLGNGKIVLTQIGKGEQTLEVDVRGGSKHVALDGHAWDKFRVVATSEGYLGAEDTCTATEPGETASVMLILLKQ